MRPELARLLWVTAAVAVAVVLVQRLGSVPMPFVTVALLASLCAPLVAWLQAKRVPPLVLLRHARACCSSSNFYLS